jgi:hypothetical protein
MGEVGLVGVTAECVVELQPWPCVSHTVRGGGAQVIS